MGDVTLAVLSDQRHGDPLDPHGCVALTCGRKDIPQRPLDPCIGGHQPPTGGTQDIACGKNGAAGGIGVNEAPFRVDEIHARAEPIEGIDKCRDFADLELEHSANQDGTPDVRSDQSHLPARAVIDETVSLVAEHAEYGRTDRGPVENGAYEIDEALRLRPLTI
jgi:hypothetical protein